jgi:hypothetical protein
MTATNYNQDAEDDQIVAEDVHEIRASIARRASGAIKRVRAQAARILARAPGTVQDSVAATKDGARATTTALQTLPDSTLRWLAASSVGLGAGLYLAGKQRLLIAVGIAPAVFMGAAIALRPTKHAVPPKSAA